MANTEAKTEAGRGVEILLDIDIDDVEAVAAEIGYDVRDWPGNCYGVAMAILDAGIVRGKLCYGHYSGPVAPGGLFNHENPIQRHGWIELPDGRVYDPTRYVFECKDPYIYVGPADGHYDVGGNAFRQALQDATEGGRPKFPREDDVSEPRLRNCLAPDVNLVITGMVGHTRPLTNGELFRVANAPPATYGRHCEVIYKTLIACGHGALIPIDNRKYVLED